MAIRSASDGDRRIATSPSAEPSRVIPLDLDDYRSLVRLDEPFVAPPPVPAAADRRAALVDELLTYLQAERGETGGGNRSSRDEKRRWLRALLTVRGPDPLPDWVHDRLDRLLRREVLDRGVTDIANLPRLPRNWLGADRDAATTAILWRGDIATLNADAIVNAANAQMLGCFQPFHGCIDNAIHSAAGPRVREDCDKIMRRQGGAEGTGWAKVTRAYNLPSRYILHTVGPIVAPDRLRPEHERWLAACYRSCLDLASRVRDIRSVAFCAISTGVFGFPREPAARVALRAISGWLDDHPGALDSIVLNVFSQDDFQIYQRLLRGEGTEETHVRPP
ncbi:MAG: protein-ADP-ribose hydrolase [Candidatus Competibacter sp.]|nr:protein-ADP-ribose hydrolase [Candidatus Competibacter sp.]MDG4582922.1 protein-ADP-ribose hydrolase [Candidatus Competibacter sp.]